MDENFEAVLESLDFIKEHMATKADLAQFPTKSDLVDLRTEMKADLAELRAEMKGEFASIRAELDRVRQGGGNLGAVIAPLQAAIFGGAAASSATPAMVSRLI